MPIRLIGTIILLILVTIFAGVNLDNKCDITFVFYTFKDIPVFMTVIVSFAVGAVLMLPFTLGRKKKKKSQPAPQKAENQQKKIEADTDSKTLFDFKIRREKIENGKRKGENEPAKSEIAEGGNLSAKPAEKPKKGRKSLFSFGKKKTEAADSKNPADSANAANGTTSASATADSASADAASTGAPV